MSSSSSGVPPVRLAANPPPPEQKQEEELNQELFPPLNAQQSEALLRELCATISNQSFAALKDIYANIYGARPTGDRNRSKRLLCSTLASHFLGTAAAAAIEVKVEDIGKKEDFLDSVTLDVLEDPYLIVTTGNAAHDIKYAYSQKSITGMIRSGMLKVDPFLRLPVVSVQPHTIKQAALQMYYEQSGTYVVKPRRGFVGIDTGSPIECVSIAPDGSRVVSSGEDFIGVWDAHTGRSERRMATSSDIVSLAFSPDSSLIVSGGAEPVDNLILWIADTGNIDKRLIGHDEMIGSVAFSPDGGRIVSGGVYESIRVWNVATGTQELRIEANAYAVAFSPDGLRIVAGGIHGSYIWNATTTTTNGAPPILQLDGGGEGIIVTSVAYSPDGHYVLSASNTDAFLWDMETGEQLHMVGHTDQIHSAVFSPDGIRVISGGDDGVRIWNIQTVAHEFFFPRPGINSVAVSPDGARIFSGGDDGMIRVWPMFPLI